MSFLAVLTIFMLVANSILSDDFVVDDLSNIARLRKKLLDGYQRFARPVKNHKTQTNVSVAMDITVTDVDIKDMSMKSSNYIYLQWNDEHLVWNASDYGGLDIMVMSAYEVWTPDIRSFHFDHRWDTFLDNPYLNVSSKGLVFWYATSTWKSRCRIDLKDYPFDTQVCFLKFASWTYDSRGIKLKILNYEPWQIYGITLDRTESSIWKVVNISQAIESNNDTGLFIYDFVLVTLTLRRGSQAYIYQIVLPYLSGLVLGVISFLEPVGSIRRVCIALPSIAILFIILTRLTIELGSHSFSIPYGIKCCGISIIMVSVGTFLPVMLLQASQSRRLLPRRLVSFLGHPWTTKLFCLQENMINQNEEQLIERQEEKVVLKEWMSLISVVDSICFWTFLILASIYHS